MVALSLSPSSSFCHYVGRARMHLFLFAAIIFRFLSYAIVLSHQFSSLSASVMCTLSCFSFRFDVIFSHFIYGDVRYCWSTSQSGVLASVLFGQCCAWLWPQFVRYNTVYMHKQKQRVCHTAIQISILCRSSFCNHLATIVHRCFFSFSFLSSLLQFAFQLFFFFCFFLLFLHLSIAIIHCFLCWTIHRKLNFFWQPSHLH